MDEYNAHWVKAFQEARDEGDYEILVEKLWNEAFQDAVDEVCRRPDVFKEQLLENEDWQKALALTA